MGGGAHGFVEDDYEYGSMLPEEMGLGGEEARDDDEGDDVARRKGKSRRERRRRTAQRRKRFAYLKSAPADEDCVIMPVLAAAAPPRVAPEGSDSDGVVVPVQDRRPHGKAPPPRAAARKRADGLDPETSAFHPQWVRDQWAAYAPPAVPLPSTHPPRAPATPGRGEEEDLCMLRGECPATAACVDYLFEDEASPPPLRSALRAGPRRAGAAAVRIIAVDDAS